MIVSLKIMAVEPGNSFSEMINVLFAIYRHRIYKMQCRLEDQESRYLTLDKA